LWGQAILPRIGFHFDDFGHGLGNAVATLSGAEVKTDLKTNA